LQAFYRHYYQPDNAVLLIAGKFDPETALKLATESFGTIPKPVRPLQSSYTVEPGQDGERSLTVQRAGDTRLVMAGYHVPAGSHPDAAALDVLVQVLMKLP
jgi:zinc protease